MGELINFPVNDDTETFKRYVRRCGQPEPICGSPCIEPAGHDGPHAANPTGSMRVHWCDAYPGADR